MKKKLLRFNKSIRNSLKIVFFKRKIETIYLNSLITKSHFALKNIYTVYRDKKIQNSILSYP